MDMIRYCDRVSEELTILKAAVYDLMRTETRMPESERSPSSLQQMHLLIDEIGRGIAELRDDPPREGARYQEAIDAKLGRLKNMIDENSKRVSKKTFCDRLAWG